MKKLLVPAILIVGLIFIFGTSYNRFMSADQRVQEQMGQLQNEVQRQSDLIPNLVNTVKGYATHEHDTLTDYAGARTGETALNKIDPRTVDDKTLQEKFWRPRPGTHRKSRPSTLWWNSPPSCRPIRILPA